MYGQPTRSGRFELPGGAASRYSGAPIEVTLSVSVCSPIGTSFQKPRGGNSLKYLSLANSVVCLSSTNSASTFVSSWMA